MTQAHADKSLWDPGVAVTWPSKGLDPPYKAHDDPNVKRRLNVSFKQVSAPQDMIVLRSCTVFLQKKCARLRNVGPCKANGKDSTTDTVHFANWESQDQYFINVTHAVPVDLLKKRLDKVGSAKGARKDDTYATVLFKTIEWQTEQRINFSDHRPWFAYIRVLNVLDATYADTVFAWVKDCMMYPDVLRISNPCLHGLLSQPWMQLRIPDAQSESSLSHREDIQWTLQPLKAQWDESSIRESSIHASSIHESSIHELPPIVLDPQDFQDASQEQDEAAAGDSSGMTFDHTFAHAASATVSQEDLMYVDASLDAHPLWTTAYHFPDSTAQFLDEADESQALSASFMDTGSPRVSAANFYSISEQAFQQCQKDGQGKASQSHLISFLAELLQQQAAQACQSLFFVHEAYQGGQQYLGDQAYWRRRHHDTTAFKTGDIALIRSQKLCRIGHEGGYTRVAGDQFVVVSDAVAKWKGGYQPTPAEEPQGHWCAAIGQVRVLVTGQIRPQDFITASLSNPPAGQRADPHDASSVQHLVALALEDKTTEGTGYVQAFVLFGLGAIASLGTRGASAVAAELKDLKHACLQTEKDLQDCTTSEAQFAHLSSRVDAHDRHNAAQDAAIASLQALAISPTSPGSSGWQRACHTAEPANHFVGREAALQTLQQLLAEKQRRVVALSGAVGMGKTTLANALAWHMFKSQQADCTRFITLEGVHTIPEAVLQIQQSLFPLQASHLQDFKDVGAALRRLCACVQQQAHSQKVLLVLDNVDDLLNASHALEEMLRTMLNLIPSLLVVTTSRPCIGFIDLPHEELKVDTLCSEDAEKLLTITAPELSKTSAAMLARHCGNIPYALRIVGCTVEQRALTAQDMIKAIEAKGGASVDAQAAASNTFATMQQRIAPSLKQLNPADRLSLAQLTLFPAKFSLAAAAAVLGLPEDKTKQTLLCLCKRAFVLISQIDTSRPFELHLLIRQMAALEQQQEAAFQSALQRFVQYYIGLLQSAEYYFAVKVGSGHTFAQLAAERKSFTLVFQTLSQLSRAPRVDQEGTALIKQLCSLGRPALQAIYDLRLDEPIITGALRNLVQWTQRAPKGSQMGSSVVDACEQLGFYLANSKPREARKLLKTVLKSRQSGADSFSLVMPLLGLAKAERSLSWSSSLSEAQTLLARLRAHDYLSRALDILKCIRGMQDPYTIDCLSYTAHFVNNGQEATWDACRALLAFSRHCLGGKHALTLSIMSRLAGDLAEFGIADLEAAEAVGLSKECLAAVSESGGNVGAIADATVTVAQALLLTHDLASEQEGLLKLQQAAAMTDSEFGVGSLESLELRIGDLVPALIQLQRYEDVVEIVLQDTPMYDSMDMDPEVSFCLRASASQWLADAYCGKGNLADAERLLRVLLVQCETYSDAKRDVNMRLASMLARQGRYREAEHMHEAALHNLTSAEEPIDWLKEHCLGLGSIRRCQGQTQAAQMMLRRAAEAQCEKDPDNSELWPILLEHARVVRDMGNADTARKEMMSLLAVLKAANLKPSRGNVPTVCADIHPKQVCVAVALDLAWSDWCSANWAQALQWFEAALTVISQLHKTGSVLDMAVASAGAAAALMRLQRPEAAAIHAEAAADSLALYDYKQGGLQSALIYLGMYKLLSGCFSQARECFDRALVVQHHVYSADHPATLYLVAACADADPPSVVPA